MLKYFILLFSVFLLSSCSVSFIATQWSAPQNTKLKIIDADLLLVYDGSIPAEITLSNKEGGYFVDILTSDNKHLYGTLEVFEGTKLTELSHVKVEITESIISKVLDNQVSQITVNDPGAQKLILRLTMGNKMPEGMKKENAPKKYLFD